MKQEEVILRNLWTKVYLWAKQKHPALPNLLLRVDCPLALRNRKTSPRAFMHTMHVPGKVCIASEACGLAAEHLVGLFLHEMGHLIAVREWKRTEQEDADLACREFFGVPIRYKGDLLLQWVPTHTMMKILRQGTRLR